MSQAKKFREHGKLRLSEYFKKFNENETVCVVREASVKCSFPKRIMGKSGKILGLRGSYYLVKLNDLNKEKTFIIHPVHLKLLNIKENKLIKKKQ
jgi:large subunit ribosomal protein L21e